MGLRSKSGIKRTKTSRKRRERNLLTKKTVKKAFKAVEKAVVSKSSEVGDLIKTAFSAIDKAVQRGIIHRNKAARRKSRLAQKFGKMEK